MCPECGKGSLDCLGHRSVGVSIHLARYRITFAPVEGVFDGEDGVRDVIRHSAWGEDREFNDAAFEKVESAVPPEKYPWICECGECVSETNVGRCSYCGEVRWRKREP